MVNKLLLFGDIGDIIVNGLKTLTFWIDKGIYTLVEGAYTVFYYLADASILTPEVVNRVTTRIYALLGVIMVFVMAFNLLNYIVDPDKITDKKVGASTFVKDVILALVIISITPMLFTKLYALQSKIITSGVISNLILGGISTEDISADEIIQNGGRSMIASVYTAFLYPADGSFSTLDCGDPDNAFSQYSEYCDAYTKVKETGDLQEFSSYITNADYTFTPFLSTVAGIVLLFFMFSFCLNLAKRVGKIAIMQLIAPVPVTLELLPNKKGLRDNWINTLIKIYLEVFFYLLVMFMIIFLISLVPATVSQLLKNATGNLSFLKIVMMLMLIYGLLIFGREAPQMIFDLLGIKSSGMIKEAAVRAYRMAGATTAGVGAGATSIARNAYSAGRNFQEHNIAGGLGNVAGAFTGGFTGLVRGMYANRTGGFRNIGRTTSQATNANLEAQRRTAIRMRNAAHDLGEYGNSVRNAQGILGKAGAITRPARDPIIDWARGNSYGALNAELDSYNEYKNIFDKTKITPATDQRHLNLQQNLDKVFSDNGIDQNAFNASKKAYLKNHSGATLDDYLRSSDFVHDFGTAGVHASADISRLQSALDSREAQMKIGKKSDLLISVAKAKALVETNTDVANIARQAGIDIGAINITSSSSDAELISAYDTLKKLNTEIGNKSTEIRTRIADHEIRERQRQQGRGQGGNGNGGGGGR